MMLRLFPIFISVHNAQLVFEPDLRIESSSPSAAEVGLPNNYQQTISGTHDLLGGGEAKAATLAPWREDAERRAADSSTRGSQVEAKPLAKPVGHFSDFSQHQAFAATGPIE